MTAKPENNNNNNNNEMLTKQNGEMSCDQKLKLAKSLWKAKLC